MIHSLWMGLRLWGMVLLPIFPAEGSINSPNFRLAQVVDLTGDPGTGSGEQRTEGHHLGDAIPGAVPHRLRHPQSQEVERPFLHLEPLLPP